MTDAPERMWRERIAPSQMYPDGGSFYHETPTKRPSVEYIRADLARPMTVAEAKLIGLMPEVIASLEATKCNVSLVKDIRAALRTLSKLHN